MADGVDARMRALAARLPGGIVAHKYWDQTTLVRDSQKSLRDAIAIGAVLAILVILVFLRNVRMTLIAAFVIPIAIAIVIFVIGRLNQTLNLMSVGGLAVAVGLIIDDAIVVIENFARNHREHPEKKMRETVVTLRKSLDGGRTNPKVEGKQPIYLAGVSRPMVRLAGEIADGWIPTWFSPEHVGEFKKLLEDGAARAGRSLNGFEIAPTVQAYVSDDLDKARDLMRPVLALYVGGMGSRKQNFYNRIMQRYGFEQTIVRPTFMVSERDGKWRKIVQSLLALPSTLRAADSSAEGMEFFERKVRPILARHCYSCHSANAKKLRGGLRPDQVWPAAA